MRWGLSRKFMVCKIHKLSSIPLRLAAWAVYSVFPVCMTNKQDWMEGGWLVSSPYYNWLIMNISCSISIFSLEYSVLESSIFHIQFVCLLARVSGRTFQREFVEEEIRGCDSEFSESSPCRNLAEDRISSWDAKFSGPGPEANFECMAHITLFPN